MNCSTTGRTCDGYHPSFQFRVVTINSNTDIDSATSSSTISTPISRTDQSPDTYESSSSINENNLCIGKSLSVRHGSSQEDKLFIFFRRNLAPRLGGHFDTDFWLIQLPRVASCEPAIYHAIIANAALEQDELQDNEEPGSESHVRFLLHYNKAIHHIKQKLQQEENSQLVILLTCLLFISLEFKRGNHDVALSHFQNGLSILRSQKPSHETSELSDIEENIRHLFSRLSIQSSLVGLMGHQPLPASQDQRDSLESGHVAFSSIEEARNQLTSHFIDGLEPLGSDFTFQASFSTTPSEQARRAKLISQLHQWNSQLGLFMTDTLSSPTPQDMRVIRLLRIQSLVAIIWNSTTIPSTDGASIELAFDSHIKMFQTILSLAAFFVVGSPNQDSSKESSASTLVSAFHTPSSNSSTSSPLPTSTVSTSNLRSSFSFEMGIIFSLYFVAIKCRSPILRRQATDFLSQVEPSREGMWDARVLEKIAQHVIEVEESSCVEPVTEDMRTWPGDEGRIHGIYIFTRCYYARRRQMVTLYWGPSESRAELELAKEITF